MVAFATISTERLSIRPMRPDDAESLWMRRNDPEAARYQNWTLPFPRERADEMVASIAATSGPASDDWWMATVCRRSDDVIVGDLALHLTFDGRVAEIGYTFARKWWGQGYATEAATALADWLVDTVGVSRVSGMTHPDNLASITVLERLGMRFEGHTRNSYWVGDENSDDWILGMTADERRAWRDRDRTPPDEVKLIEITRDNAGQVEVLETHRSQRRFASPISNSMRYIAFPPFEEGGVVVPWPRAIEADGTIVGFAMMTEPTEIHPEPYLWRLMVDRMHQRRGIGARALRLVIEQSRAWGASTMAVSWVPGIGTPEPLYLSAGFEPTGVIEDGEIEGRLQLT